MQCTHSNQLADVGMLQINKAEAKRYEEENITIMSMIISSSHSYIYYIFLKFYTRSGVFLLLTALYTNKARFFRARSFCIAKSNANRNSHGLLKYLRSINSYLKSSNAGQHRTKWTSVSTAERHNGHFNSSTLWSLYILIYAHTLCICLNVTLCRVQHRLMF